MSSGRLKTEVAPAALTGVAGVATLAAVLLFRDQLPISKGAGWVVGFSVLYVGFALFLWAAYHLKGAVGGFIAPRLDNLIVAGPFRFVRHPTYLGMTISMVGASMVTRSIVGLVLSALLFLPVEIYRARLEERALEDTFGDTWREYVSRTGFFLPRFGSGLW